METQPELEEKRAAFVKEIEERLSKGESGAAVDFASEPKNEELFKASGFELIPIAGKYLTSSAKSSDAAAFDVAVAILEMIVRECTAQETYLELLELVDSEDDVKFAVILDLIQRCLFRMPKQRAKSICWTCDAIVRHLSRMERPSETDEPEGERNQRNETILEDIASVYRSIGEFFRPFVEESLMSGDGEIAADQIFEYRDQIIKCLLKCLGPPLVHVNLSGDRRQISAELMNLIDSYVDDPFELLDHVDLSFGCVESLEDDAVSFDYNNVSLGCYFYLVLTDDEKLNRISHVYSVKYLFECTMAMAFDLMGANESPLIFKALVLLKSVLSRMSTECVEFNCISDTVMSKFLEMITRSMVHNEMKSVRQLSVEIFPRFVEKFCPEGRYMILYNADHFSAHPGFVGFAVTLVKEEVRKALETNDPLALRYFTGPKLVDVLNRYCRVSGLVEADLQSHTDQIISCLNLVRYLAIRDAPIRTAGVASYLSRVVDSYLEPVKKACNFARGLYEDYKSEAVKPKENRVNLSISPSNLHLPEMTSDEAVAMMNENITRVDLIHCLATRVTQCVDEYSANANINVSSQ